MSDGRFMQPHDCAASPPRAQGADATNSMDFQIWAISIPFHAAELTM